MEMGHLKIDGDQVFVTREFLTDRFIPSATIESAIGNGPARGSSDYVHYFDRGADRLWINYASIPAGDLERHGLPADSRTLVRILCDACSEGEGAADVSLLFLLNITWHVERYWIGLVPFYRPYHIDAPKVEKLAKTHAVLDTLLTLAKEKRYTVRTLYFTYMRMPHVYFKAGSLSYFYRKMRAFREHGIAEVLVHNFTRYGREPYKIDDKVKALIKRHYISKKRYKVCMIHKLVNSDLMSRGMTGISRSAVSKVVNDPEFRNRADFIRLGRGYAEKNVLPYLKRSKVREVGELYQIDGKDVHIKAKMGGSVVKVWMFVVMDCASRKVVGHDFGTSENSLMVLSSLKMAFERERLVPGHIVYDRHSVSKGVMYRDFKSKARDYGIAMRECRDGNPKDKGHVENWFGHFAIYHLSRIKGFLGHDIKSGTVGGRADRDTERLYGLGAEMRTFGDVASVLRKEIALYNGEASGADGMSPDKIFDNGRKKAKKKFRSHQLAHLFGLEKKLTVRRGMIGFRHNGNWMSYTVRERGLANRVNGTKVRLFYHPENPSVCYLFDMGCRFLGKTALDVELSPVSSSPEDIRYMQDFYLENIQKVVEDTNEVLEEIERGGVELELATVSVLDEGVQSELDELKKEDIRLVRKTLLLSRPYHGAGKDATGDPRFQRVPGKGRNGKKQKRIDTMGKELLNLANFDMVQKLCRVALEKSEFFAPPGRDR